MSNSSVNVIKVQCSKLTRLPYIRCTDQGDLHDRNYDKYARSGILNEIQTDASLSTVYNLTLYPSSRMLDEFQTKSPIGVSLGFVAVLLCSTSLFFLYDFFMRHESQQRKIILEVKRRFVRFVSHEIRTPLNTVCLGLELLQAELKSGCKNESNREDNGKKHPTVCTQSRDFINNNGGSLIGTESNNAQSSTGYDNEIRVRWLSLSDDILENANNAVGILNDLLDYDKIEQETFKLEIGTVNIWKLVRVTVSSFKIQADKRNMSLLLTLGDLSPRRVDDEEVGVKPSLARLHVIGDDTRLRHVIRNVISNSLKFSPENTGVIHVTMSYNPLGLPNAEAPKEDIMQKVATSKLACSYPRMGSIVIRVHDNGVGMTPEQVSRLFKEGVQFEANKLQVRHL